MPAEENLFPLLLMFFLGDQVKRQTCEMRPTLEGMASVRRWSCERKKRVESAPRNVKHQACSARNGAMRSKKDDSKRAGEWWKKEENAQHEEAMR